MFRDTHSIQGGQPWPDRIRDAVRGCRVMIVLIGKQWLSMRLNDPEDWVRQEIALAFEHAHVVIPVVLPRAETPPRAHLPDVLRPLVDRNARQVHADPAFDRDVEAFADEIASILGLAERDQPHDLREDESRAAFVDRLTSVRAFDGDVVRRYRGALRASVRTRLPDGLPAEEFLVRRGHLREGRLTVSGTLLFTPRPASNPLTPTAHIRCVRYYGIDKTADRQREEYDGPLFDQILAALAFVTERTERRERPVAGAAVAETIYRYPMICVREMIANAVCHRQYDLPDQMARVAIFDDRIEVSSPGAWAAGTTVDVGPLSLEQLASSSVTRNHSLAIAVASVDLVEAEGSGIPKAIEDCKRIDAPSPTVSIDNGGVTVTIFPSRRWASTLVQTSTVSPLYNVPLRRAQAFFGRERELLELEKELAPTVGDRRDVSVEGVAGVGKTELALQLVHRLAAAAAFPGGIFWFDGSQPDLDTLWGGPIADALAVGPAPLRDRAAAARRMVVGGGPVLIVLDNVIGGSTGQLPSPLVGGPHVALLVTTREHRFGGSAFSHMSLDMLGLQAARAMLDTVAGREVTSEAGADELLEALRGHPLAIELAAAHLAKSSETPAAYRGRLARDEAWVARQSLEEVPIRRAAVAAGASLGATLGAALHAAPSPSAGLPPVAAAGQPLSDDQDVVEATLDGDTSTAVHVLMNRHGTGVYRFCRGMLGDDALADDVFQQVFLDVFRDLEAWVARDRDRGVRFEQRGSLRAWLYSIARRRCLDAIKALGRHSRRTAQLPVPDATDNATPSVFEGVSHVEMSRALELCLEELAPAVKSAVLLRYSEGLPYEEMGTVLGERPGTLQARVARALPLLRKCLERRLRPDE